MVRIGISVISTVRVGFLSTMNLQVGGFWGFCVRFFVRGP